MGKQTYSLLDDTSGVPLARPKCLNLLGRKKQRKTNNVIQGLQKGMIISQQGLKAPAVSCVGLAAS